ncbi:MAG TPA: thioredoxin family protein [Candidatus Bathyarchaeia archaeon]|nr:thioredoxin family protein [Candidatus Bathyarchaeia archaeon]
MPRPPILPVIDWENVFNSGKTFADWLAAGESRENCDAMELARNTLRFDTQGTWVFPRPVHVVAIAEDWCGDVVRHVPVLEAIAAGADKLHVRYISREQWPDVFARFLTNGGEAIPKFIFLNDTFVECGNWGPMPEPYKTLIARGKACGDVAAARKKVAGFYEADANRRMVFEELLHLIDVALTCEP